MRVVFGIIAALVASGAAQAMAQTAPVLTPSTQTASATEGATDIAIQFDAVTPGYDKPLFPDVQFDSTKLTQDGPISSSAPNTYHAAFKTVATLPGGVTTGTITFRMCRDSPCTRPWPGTEQIFSYTINVALKDWVTYQRDAGHSGYVHASYAGVIKKRWVWQPTDTVRLYPVATKGSSIFLAFVDYRGSNVVSLSMLGAPQWVSPVPRGIYSAGPAISGDTVYVAPATSSSMESPIFAFDANSGVSGTPTMTFDTQSTMVTAPTPFGDSLYIAAGYNGNEVLSFDLATQAGRWNSYGQGAWIWGGETPAVDKDHVYYYSGGYLDTFDRATGQRTASVTDPTFDFANTNGAAIHYFFGGPMLGTGGNVIVLDGTAAQAPLMKFTPAGDAIRLGPAVYWGPAAIAKGVVYAAGYSNVAAHLDAVNEADGALLWTWSLPTDDQTYITNNIIVTDTLIFASSQSRLYAISATDPAHPVVWSAATPGNIAISRDNLLLVTTVLNGHPALVAYSVK
ncbi:MAG: hypothetical protein ABIO86_18350 [Sphingomonas sp.]